MSDFDRWFFAVKSSVKPDLPLMSEILFVYAKDDEQQFNGLCAILEQCFNAGVKVGESK